MKTLTEQPYKTFNRSP